MNYKKFSDEEILESYTTAQDYSSKIDNDLIAEIDIRGGIDQLKKNASERNIVPEEIKRINKLVFELYKADHSSNKIRSSITSNILSIDQLNYTIDQAIKSTERYVMDRSINSQTIIGSILGFILSSTVGAGLWYYTIIQTGKMYYILTALILIMSYIIIRILTRQSKSNALVFIVTFMSAFTAIPLGLWLVKLFAN